MFTHRLAFAALAAGCLVAAGAGGYIATRQNSIPQPAAASTRPAPAVAPPASVPVTESTADVMVAPPPEAGKAAPKAETRPAARAPRPTAPEPVRRIAPDRAIAAAPQAATQAPLPSAPPPAVAVQAEPLPPAREGDRAEDARTPEPAPRELQELVVPADSVVGLQIETPVSSERARIEDRVDARVTRDVRANGHVAIPAGVRAIGSVTIVERGGKFKERARLGVRFHTLVFPDGTRLPISTDTIYREGDAPGNESAAKIGGGAVGGAILGAILGGARGAMIGATTGAGAGTAAVAAGERNAAVLAAGTPVTARLLSPVTVTYEQD